MQTIVFLVGALAAVALEIRPSSWGEACALVALARGAKECHALQAMLVLEKVHSVGHEVQYSPADGPETEPCSSEEDHLWHLLDEQALE